jgi:hypothetical protein
LQVKDDNPEEKDEGENEDLQIDEDLPRVMTITVDNNT